MKSEVRIDGNRVEIQRVFAAPREEVFEAWSHADPMQRWWGCKGATNVVCQMDFRSGGRFTHSMQIEGCGEVVYTGTYDEIVAPEWIAYHAKSQEHVERVTVRFIDQGATTKLILTQEGLPDAWACQMVSEGFSTAFDNLERVLSDVPA